jgi:hypothetical protein
MVAGNGGEDDIGKESHHREGEGQAADEEQEGN